ncbi:acyl-CoA dehydrogenase family protein [Actinoplanes oblitus]|uniref:Acyl-CoA dehydrogenase family protein n=1 Tax=Actinoplanes oblitus TaxID=3040509 RepID=A0ABY8WWA1_9ACTN|nr:acyl-CoA dehydrogenase family protein [Actinoplanes oblitus]WIN00471.1 acyl-CoA dehydrogenase family protein [Actinoplanes oblitus]
MDFTLTDEARDLAALTRDLAASGRRLWPALADAGVLAAALPERAGGEGYGLIEQCAILIELGRAAADVPYLSSIVGAASAIARFGTEEQVATLAVPAGQGRLVLTAAQAPDGPDATAWLAAHTTVGACAAQLGVVERALEMTAEYARSRVQFGRPIGSFQAVTQRLADAYLDVEGLRLALWQAACRPGRAEVATAGFWAAEAGHRVLHTAVHVHGGVGLDLDYPLHRYFLAAKHHEFLLGGATRQLLDLAGTFPTELEHVTVQG